MSTRVIITVHSFVDLITNSSSEVFMNCNDKSIPVLKGLVNDIIKLANPNSKLTANDLFIFEMIQANKHGTPIEQVDDTDERAYLIENGRVVDRIKVTVKDKSNELAKNIAARLSDIPSLINAFAVYN